MPLYTHIITVELADDAEATELFMEANSYLGGYAEVIQQRFYRDVNAEAAAALVGVEWGGR